MRPSRLIFLIVFGATFVAQADSVQTRAGRTIEGRITIGVDGFRVVTPDGKGEIIPFAQLKRAVFDALSAVAIPASATNSAVIPALTPVFPPATVPIGVLTWGGAFLAGGVRGADDSAVRLTDPPAGFTLTTANTAAIFFQPITPYRASRLRAARPGVLLVNGDFVEGEFKSLESGSIKLTSVLFGERSFEVIREAAAVILRKPSLPMEQFEVQLRDGSILLARALRAEAGVLTLDDPFLRDLRLPAAQIEEIAFGKTTNRIALAWAVWESLAETDRLRFEQQEKLIAKVALEQGLRWRSHTELLDQVRVAAEKAAEKTLVLANAAREMDAVLQIATVAVAAHGQAVIDFTNKEKIYIELAHKAALLAAEAKSKTTALGGTKLEFDRAVSKLKFDRTVADANLATQRRGAEFAVKAGESRVKSARDLKEVSGELLVSAKGQVALHTESLEKSRKKLTEADQDVATRKERLANAKEAEKKAETAGKRKEAEIARAAADKSLASMQGLRTLAETHVSHAVAALMRVKIAEGIRIKTLAERAASFEKAVMDLAAAQKKEKADVAAAEMKLAKAIADNEKLLAEMQAKLKLVDAGKVTGDKSAIEALLAAEKALTEKNNAFNASFMAKATVTKAQAEMTRKRDVFNLAKVSAEKAQAEKVAVAKLLAQQPASGFPK